MTSDDGFDWDEAKAVENYANHRVTFDVAKRVFQDPFAIEWMDDRYDYGEERFAILGMVDGRLLFVAYRAERHDPHHLRTRSRAL
jgi:uncharacterized DUF497 family protein